MSHEPEKIAASGQKNINSKPDYITQEPVMCPPTGRFYNSTDDAKDYASSLGQYVPLEEPAVTSSASGSFKPPSKRTSSSESNSRGRKQKFQNSWQAKSDNSLKRNSREKNDEHCCDFCCLCLANFCLHLQ